MITGFGLVCLNVLDLDEAKDFYVDMLGFEVGIDEVMDGFRWLTVHAPGTPDLPMMLVVPGAPVVEERDRRADAQPVARGYLGLGAMSHRRLPGDVPRSSRRRAWSSSRSPRSGSTASTRRSATRSATTGG